MIAGESSGVHLEIHLFFSVKRLLHPFKGEHGD